MKKGRRANANSASTLTSPSSPTVVTSSSIDKPDSGGTSSSSNNMNAVSDERSLEDVDDYFNSMPKVKRIGGWADEAIKYFISEFFFVRLFLQFFFVDRITKSATNVIEQ